MNNIEMLNTDIDELKAEILGEYVDNEEDKLNDLISLAMMLGEACVYRDSVVTPKVKQKFNIN